ncbi:hypothetical protein HFU84_05715 [Acidithiobacillus sp. CV18-2]|uniref:Uncharacterized protein n=1 Tax=Igneacidithiobacillus copahuensis TaxID=2724909 RepID=A0AAE2YN67_9PROT|nr:hypothetical protein [Igneacidithiobacillus copahuensis]MBU2754296.1 hypothetical protein [Acidithiobacillus sp. CV18-3]MBU2757681.1 hypothetical protein [Acidithiobacillus sp. BN09-2]MBU2777004.1 hypothetical protein [Acidithiobacillus sp. CV18-2]MBU2797308.1 hypothetical protein [Acidithiobacillus sp. VAN18-2]MBU2799845.1 hypothetical protein [Acidithiobacillus sp. VAN18-4]UTV82010.1 hypothetical protein MQE22_05135 [Acidithiobacillus sp. YTS05]
MATSTVVEAQVKEFAHQLCHPKALGIRAAFFILYAVCIGVWPSLWLTFTLAFFSAYTLAHGIYCFSVLPKLQGSLTESPGLARRSAIDVAIGSSIAVGLLAQGNAHVLLLIATLWFLASVLIEFRWLMQHHHAWEKFFFLSLGLYLPIAYVLQMLFVLGRETNIVEVVSINLLILACVGAAALTVLALLGSPKARRQFLSRSIRSNKGDFFAESAGVH